jgi:hypothetical protein
VWAFQKSLYSLKQASNIWNTAIHEYILELGFKHTSVDLCVYTISFKEKDQMIIAIHVNNFLIAIQEVHFQWLVKASNDTALHTTKPTYALKSKLSVIAQAAPTSLSSTTSKSF